ncbi:MAG: hypothetical protein ABID45_04820 [Patescibacteria group bacterium]
MSDKKTKKKDKLNENIKRLVIARLEVLPSDRKISLGSEGSFTKEEMINHVEENDAVGKKISQVQLEYLQMLKEGSIFYEQ